jgi:hypothetical protein
MSELIGRGPGRPFQPGQSGNPGGRLTRSSTEISRGQGAKVARNMVKGLFAPDAPFTSAGIANAHDLWCFCEGTVTEKFVINGGSTNFAATLLHPNYWQRTDVASVAEPVADMLLPGFDALPDLDGRPPAPPDENTPIPDTATLRAVLRRYLLYAIAVITRGATAPGTEMTSVGNTARKIMLERGYGKPTNTLEIDGEANTPVAMHLAALMALSAENQVNTFAAVPASAADSLLGATTGLDRSEGDPRACVGGDHTDEADGAELWFVRARQHRAT